MNNRIHALLDLCMQAQEKGFALEFHVAPECTTLIVYSDNFEKVITWHTVFTKDLNAGRQADNMERVLKELIG